MSSQAAENLIKVRLSGGPYDGGVAGVPTKSASGKPSIPSRVTLAIKNDAAHTQAVYAFFELGKDAVMTYRYKERE